ncbi:unnamed protein product [Adineta ricciae]|uniref:Uncharacterized protein n=1 Tax=Adineta ricciae TaxID=249248 RepID=A0A815MWT9_ADIRI|nr:unnamed protein product [Adineta ricciae]CAF1501022.1 unnamed protein product [Adineta ricciae]
MIPSYSNTLSNTITCTNGQKPCGDKFCYNASTHVCTETGGIVSCFNKCGNKCYDTTFQVCINDTVCRIGEAFCKEKYRYDGVEFQPAKLTCYDSQYTTCLNYTICHKKDRVCNSQCIYVTSWNEYDHKICANDNVTLCDVPQHYKTYDRNQIQVCNGKCFDTQYKGPTHCVNGVIQCIWNCSNECYNASTSICINGKRCLIGEDACLTNYTSYGYPLTRPEMNCYNPSSQKCVNGVLCGVDQNACLTSYDSSNEKSLDRQEMKCYDPVKSTCIDSALCSKARICNGRCITGPNATHQVCATDNRTICNVSLPFDNYQRYQMHLCNGKCYNALLEQCVSGIVQCFDKSCGGQCYDSAISHCINNNKICKLGEALCEQKYDYYGVQLPSVNLRCYDPQSETCLNHTICHKKDRVCNGQCIYVTSWNEYYKKICANDNVTLCDVPQHYTNYGRNRIQVCNGECFDTQDPEKGSQRCVNGAIECVSICSGQCFNSSKSVCINGTVCSIGQHTCLTSYDWYSGHLLPKPAMKCYNPSYEKCVNGRLCSVNKNACLTIYDLDGGFPLTGFKNLCYDPVKYTCIDSALCSKTRLCNGRCITGSDATHQVCASDRRTICNVSKPFNSYEFTQMQLCHGVCYDPLMEQCSGDHVVLCINDPLTQQCVPQYINSSTTTSTTISIVTSQVNSTLSQNFTNFPELFSTVSSVQPSSSTDPVITTTTFTASPSTPSMFTWFFTTFHNVFSSQPTVIETDTYGMTNSVTLSTDTNTLSQNTGDSQTSSSIPTVAQQDRVTTQVSTEATASSQSQSMDQFTTATTVTLTATPLFNSSTVGESNTEPQSSSTPAVVATPSSETIFSSTPTSSIDSTSQTSSPVSTAAEQDRDTTQVSTGATASSQSQSIGQSTTATAVTLTPTPLINPSSTSSTAGESSSLSHSSSRPTVAATPFPETTLPSISTPSIDPTSQTSSPTTSSPVSTAAEQDRDTTQVSTEATASSQSQTTRLPSTANTTGTASSAQSRSSSKFTPTSTKSSSQQTPSLTSTIPFQENCCAQTDCTNGTDCCVPRVERRCLRTTSNRDSPQMCKTIVIGPNSNNSVVVAITINDKRVIVINKTALLIFFLSIIITFVLLLVITFCLVIAFYRQRLVVPIKLWWLSIVNVINDFRRKLWERH